MARFTRIDPEEYAYNTYSGAPSRSNRYGSVRFPDGIIRRVRLGVHDTYFSIPAIPVSGRRVVGTVTVGDDGEFEFAYFPEKVN